MLWSYKFICAQFNLDTMHTAGYTQGVLWFNFETMHTSHISARFGILPTPLAST